MGQYLLHSGATVQCKHGGPASPVKPSQRVKVSGQPIVVQSTSYKITGCPNPSNPPGPCATAAWLVGATRVKSEMQPVLLQNSQSLGAPTPAPLQVIQTQQRVKGL